MKFFSKYVIALLVVAFAAGSAFAQNYPMPGSASASPVLCNGCAGKNAAQEQNEGKPTYPFRAPISKFVGRYVDSSTTPSIQHVGFRTARAGRVRIAPTQRGTAPPRAYLQIGESVGAYTLANFFGTTLPSATESVGLVARGVGLRSPLERIQLFDMFIYPEGSSDWQWQLFDAQHTLSDYDFDDRGLVYAAFPPYGWGISRDTGVSGGPAYMPKLSQIPSDPEVSNPSLVISINSGGRYYAIVSDSAASRHIRWDVTDPANPSGRVSRSGRHLGIGAWAKNDTAQRLAYVGGDGSVHIWDYSSFVGNGGEIVSFAPSAGKSIIDISFDETGSLWVAETNYPKVGKNNLVKLTPTGGSYTRQSFDVYGRNFSPRYLSAGGGFVAVAGTGTIYTGASGFDVALFKIQGGAPVLTDTDNYFSKYYHYAPPGYAQPPVDGGYTNFQSGIHLFKHEGKVYLFYSAFGLGDVYELEGSDSISVQMKTASFGTVNPNAKSTQTGPFPGDIVTFTAKSSNAAVTYPVSFDFGNEESGSLNFKVTSTGVDVTHQFTGYTTAGQVTAAKSVSATATNDPAISGSLPVALKLPTVRIGLPGAAGTLTAATPGLKLVAGESFTDASDGSVESHFATWAIDGSNLNAKPNASIPVGAVGAHTIKLTGSYGRYDATTYSISSPFVSSTPVINYTVVPFIVDLKQPSKSGNTVTFTAGARYTTDTTIMSAPTWNVTWTMSGTGASAQATQATTNPIGTIPPFVVTGPIAPDSVVSLDVAVAPSGLSLPAQQFASSQDSEVLSTPDPKIVKSGCTHANEPCSFTAGSIGNKPTTDWAVTWTVKQGTAVLFTSTANPYTPTFTESGTYTVQLKAVKSVFEANATDVILPVAAALCGPLPAADQLSITSGCANGCDVNEEVTFVANALGYSSQDCDTWSWNFGDGSPAVNTKIAKHKFATKKSYTVKVTLKNSTNTTGISTSVSINVGGSTPPPPPPPPDECTTPASIGFTWVGSQGCAPGTACKTGEQVTFTGRRGSGNLQTCDGAQWAFGDGNTSFAKSPKNTYTGTGTFTATLIVSNEHGTSSTVSQNIEVVAGNTGTCPLVPNDSNFYIKYAGAESGCNQANSIACKKGENIAFEAAGYFYNFQTCDKFEWNFGDGSALSTAKNPSKSYTANGDTFPISLRVYNNGGGATVNASIKFTNVVNTKPTPVLTYSVFPKTGSKGKTITFTATSDRSATGWVWTFGDGTADDNSQVNVVGTSSTVTHTFTSVGQKSVRVSARNSEDVSSATPGSVLDRITISEAPADPEYRYLLPVVTHIPGQNSSVWRTDVQVYHPDPSVSPTKPLTMTAQLRDMTRTLEIFSSTYIYEDFMNRFTNGNDSGPVIITVKGQYAPQIWTRTYNQTDTGTFGQFIPAIRLDDTGSGGSSFGDGKYYLAGLRHDDRYRTNLGFVNPNSATVTLNGKVYNDEGSLIGSFSRTIGSFQYDQFAIGNVIADFPKTRPFSVEVSVPAGQWLIAYASYIDSGSNDPVFIQAVRESELSSTDYRAIMLPGVGHVGPWRSDVTIYNPYGRQVNVDLSYYDQSGTKKGEALSVPIGGGEFLQYDDLIKQGIFGAVDDSLGMLRVTLSSASDADRFPMVQARTYNDGGTGKTYGQGIGAFAEARANVKPNKPAFIPAVRDNTKFYTNIGLTNTTNAAVTVTVKMLDPSTGAEIKAVPFPLKPYESVVGRFTLDGRDNASLKIEATGNVWAFASMIDKNTFDPEYVPATPLP